MFTAKLRSSVRSDLLQRAITNARVSGAALTGSAAEDREDQWSDVDLAFGIANESELPDVLAEWTSYMYDQHRALHHYDVKTGAWIYRVFLLPSTLQVDLAFVPAREFRALAPAFRVVYGEAREPRLLPPPQPEDIIGLSWLYALHARSCIARQKFWQAEYMISGIRDEALALACLRHGVPTVHGRGTDLLPREVVTPFEASLVQRLDGTELSRAFNAVTRGLLKEIRAVDAPLAERLRDTLMELTSPQR